MSDSYYTQILKTVSEMMDQGKDNEALSLVEEELSMPYVPKTFLVQFEKIALELKQKHQLDITPSVMSDPEAILKSLKQDELNQLKALDALSQLNIRAHRALVDSAFEILEDRLLKNLLIRILIEQAITDEFEFSDEGITYRFIPASLTLPEDSEGVLNAQEYLERWCEKDPSLHKLCLDQLQLVSLLKLPESFDEEEGYDLALSIHKPLYIQLNDETMYERFEHQFLKKV